MNFAESPITSCTLLILALEVSLFLLQFVYYLKRPSERERLWYLLLIAFLIGNNYFRARLPAPDLPIPMMLQYVIRHGSGLALYLYFTFYFYKTIPLPQLRSFVIYGCLLLLITPFTFLSIVPYFITGSLENGWKLSAILPCAFSLSFVYNTSRILFIRFNKTKGHQSRFPEENILALTAIYIPLLCWSILPVSLFIKDLKDIEEIVINMGFLIMSLSYIRTSVIKSKQEYLALQGFSVNETTEQIIMNIAHETRTPLTIINSYFKELRTQFPGRGEKEFAIIHAHLERLNWDMDNLLDIERIKKGLNIYNHDQAIDFSKLLQTKLDLFIPFAQKKAITIKVNIEPDLPVVVHPLALERIINNLIENAIKFTPAKGNITVSLLSSIEGVVFSVADSGPGIPEEFQQKIFEPYSHLRLPLRKHQGMGIGLSIVKKIVDDIQASIHVHSQENYGTKINIIFKRAEPHHAIAHVDTDLDQLLPQLLHFLSPVQDNFLDPKRPFILIAEGDEAMLGFLVETLKDKYNIYVTRNGTQALERIESVSQIDLIIADQSLDKLSGLELCRAVGETEWFSHVPFILLTGNKSTATKIDALKAGAIDCFSKPFEVDELIQRIESLFLHYKKHREAIFKRSYTTLLKEAKVSPSSPDPTKIFEDNCKKYKLTKKEIEIVVLVSSGQPYKIIADQLHITTKTVESHIHRIFEKVDEVTNKVELLNKLQMRSAIAGIDQNKS